MMLGADVSVIAGQAGEIVKKMLKRHRMVDPYKHPAKSFVSSSKPCLAFLLSGIFSVH